MPDPASELSPERMRLLQRRLKGAVGKAAPPRTIPSRARTDLSHPVGRITFPLSFAEERLWFMDQLEPGNVVYNLPFGLRLKGTLDVPMLERCLNEILRRHEVLRTRFEVEEGMPVQVIGPVVPLALTPEDLSGLTGDRGEAEAWSKCQAEARRPFDLKQDILLRARLFRIGPADHLLFLNIHHIVSDGWSVGLLLHELCSLYEAFAQWKASPLPELPIQYGDYAAWKRQWLQGEMLEKQLGYWKRQLAGTPALLDLPTDRPRPATPSYRGAEVSLKLSRVLTERVAEFTRREEVTPFVTLLAAFQALLHRYAGQEDLPVGTPIAGRNWKEVEGLIGFFVNTLVMRGDLSGDPSFRMLLQRTREAALSAHAHQDVPFEMLVKELQPKRDTSYSPLFQVMFVYLNLPWETTRLPGLEATTVLMENGTSKFDLTLSIRDSGQSLRAVMEYNTDLFEAERIRRMLDHYLTLLEAVVVQPDRRLSDLPLLTDAERQQALVEWNRTARDYPRHKCIHRLFEEQAACTPDAIAVCMGNQTLTYRELNERANQLASHLQGLRVGPDTLVGLCVERSLELLIGLLGILKAGGAYLPLDPGYPKDRLAFMLRDADVRVLVTMSSLEASLPELAAQTIRLDADRALIARESAANPANPVPAEHLAYVIYTSGSTGRPKGTLVTHRNVVHSTVARLFYYADPVASFLLLSSHAFDSSVAGIFWTLCQGGKLVLPRPGQERDPAELSRLVARHQISHLLSLPSLYALLLADGGTTRLKSLQVVIVAGEICPVELPEQHRRINPLAKLYNEYGPTECTVWATVCQIDQARVATTVPIGRPIANTRIYLLDAHRRPVPIGVPGELCIGGEGLTRGYLNRPELTAEKFVTDPFSKDPQVRLYRTGDRCKWLPDGNLEFLGRNDQQVKIRGFRIELGEIEAVLNQHPAVQETAVMAREDAGQDKRLVGYVVPRNRSVADSDLREFLRGKLPDHMFPSQFVVLAQLPLSPNGKVNRRMLPAPEVGRPDLPGIFVAPSKLREQQLALIFQEVLKVDRVGIHDNFFDLGGHSLLAIRLICEIKRVLKLEVPVRSLFQYPTIGELARHMPDRQTKERKSELIQLRAGSPGPELFFLVDDGSLGLLKLGRSLRADMSVYASWVPLPEPALRASVNKQTSKLPRMEDLAAEHVALISRHASNGPVVLGGRCFGGVLAFEVAHQLQLAGRQVGAVLMLDSWMERPSSWWLKATWLQAHLSKLLQQGPAYVWQKSRRRMSLEREELAAHFKLMAKGDFNMHVPWAVIHRIYRKASLGYQPVWLPICGTLFVSRDDWLSNAYRKINDSLGARKWYGGGLEVLTVPGEHVTVLDEQHLTELAQVFDQCLGRIRSAALPPGAVAQHDFMADTNQPPNPDETLATSRS